MSRTAFPWVLAFGVLALFAPVAGLAGNEDARHYDTVPVEAGEWRPWVTALGQVQSWRKADLRAPMAVLVRSVNVEEGQAVSEGDVLAELDPAPWEVLLSDIAEAKDRVSAAEDQVRQMEKLSGQHLASRSDIIQARIALTEAVQQLNEEWRDLLAHSMASDRGRLTKSEFLTRLTKDTVGDEAQESARVRAPFGGVVASRAIAPGAPVAADQAMFVLSDSSKVYVDVGLPGARLLEWPPASALAEAAGSGQTIALTPVSEQPRIDPATGLVIVRLSAPNSERRLLDGEWLEVRLEQAPVSALWVPADAVARREGRDYCIRWRDGTYEAVAVRVGREEGGRIPVLEGLDQGDNVVVRGAYELLYRDLNSIMIFQD